MRDKVNIRYDQNDLLTQTLMHSRTEKNNQVHEQHVHVVSCHLTVNENMY